MKVEECMCVCMCVWKRVDEHVCVFVCVWMCMCMCVCVCVWERERERTCVCVCTCMWVRALRVSSSVWRYFDAITICQRLVDSWIIIISFTIALCSITSDWATASSQMDGAFGRVSAWQGINPFCVMEVLKMPKDYSYGACAQLLCNLEMMTTL